MSWVTAARLIRSKGFLPLSYMVEFKYNTELLQQWEKFLFIFFAYNFLKGKWLCPASGLNSRAGTGAVKLRDEWKNLSSLPTGCRTPMAVLGFPRTESHLVTPPAFSERDLLALNWISAPWPLHLVSHTINLLTARPGLPLALQFNKRLPHAPLKCFLVVFCHLSIDHSP